MEAQAFKGLFRDFHGIDPELVLTLPAYRGVGTVEGGQCLNLARGLPVFSINAVLARSGSNSGIRSAHLSFGSPMEAYRSV